MEENIHDFSPKDNGKCFFMGGCGVSFLEKNSSARIDKCLPSSVLDPAVSVHVQSKPYGPLGWFEVAVHMEIRVRQPYVALVVDAVQNVKRRRVVDKL